MILHRWNHRSRSYDDYEVPDNWAVAVTAPTLDTFVDCAGCGKSIPFGAAFTSAEIHTVSGFGYAVCKKCNGEEVRRAKGRENRHRRSGIEESIERFDKTVGAIRAANGLPPLGGATNGKA